MTGASDGGGELALDVYALLQDLDPVRWRADLESAARERLSQLRRRAVDVLRRAKDAKEERAALLRGTLETVTAVLEQHAPDPGLPASRADWMRFRERLVPAYDALARALRAHAVHVPVIRSTNWNRSAFHLASAIGVLLLLEVLLTHTGTIVASGSFAVVCWFLEIGRALSPRINDRLMNVRFFQKIIHPHERHRVNSATWYATSLLVLAILSPTFASAAALVVLGAGDPIAAAVGRRFGRTRLVRTRTLEGSLAFVVAATLAALAVLLVWHPVAPWPVLLLVAAAAALSGALAELASVRLDDNITIPLAAGAGAAIAGALLGVV